MAIAYGPRAAKRPSRSVSSRRRTTVQAAKAAAVNPVDVAAFSGEIAAVITKYNNRLYRLKRAEDINLVVQMTVPIIMAILAMRSSR